MDWSEVPVSKSLVKFRIGRENQIPSSRIRSEGQFPVVDQGQQSIAGYSNEVDRVSKPDGPVVIFGDHTRAVKYVDFPFILGGDGTRVLKPNPDLFDPKFFYFAILNIDLPSRGYNRHYSLLKESMLPVPLLAEQRKIAAVLSLVQQTIEQQERLIALTTELKKALMHKLFTEGLRGEPQKETEIGPIPERWEVVPISDVCRLQSGGTPSKKRKDFWSGTIPWVSPKDMKSAKLTDVVDHISLEGLASGSSLAPKGSVVIVIRGMILARDVPICLLEAPMAFNQDVKAIIPGAEMDSDYLLFALINHKRSLAQKIGRSAHGTYTLMSKEIAQMLVPKPPVEDQHRIAEVLNLLERKIILHQRRQGTLRDLFRTLLHQLMTAQIRVDELDLSELLGADDQAVDAEPALVAGV